MLLSRNHPLVPIEVKSPSGLSPKLSISSTTISTTTSVSNSCGGSSSSSSNASSPESATNSGGVLVISTRKPRTPRKRPNQTYNEAAALLSTAYPNLFTSPLPRSPNDMSFFLGSAHHHHHHRDFLLITDKPPSPSPSPSPRIHHRRAALSSPTASVHSPVEEDFDAESILDVDEVGIDGIMGDLNVTAAGEDAGGGGDRWTSYGYPIGLGLGYGVRALRRDFDEANWWRFPTVDIVELTTPVPAPAPVTVKKKSSATKKMKKTRAVADVVEDIVSKESVGSPSLLLLKLNYDGVLSAWSDKGSPFSEGNENDDVAARLGDIELFLESGVREASVLRYKEKRRTRLFSKKIRYQVRKVNADQRPRMKGRFVRRANSKYEYSC